MREQGEPQVVSLPWLSETALQERVRKYLITYGQRLGWQDELNALLEWLGEVVMAPLLEALQGETRAVLIPGSWLGILPLHAARLPQGGYALDYMTFAYAPSAQALYHARRRLNGGEEHLLAVDNPRGDLFYTPWEVHAVLHYFPHNHTHLPGKQATRQAVIEALPRASVLHFSTHGNAGWGDSQQARVLLASEESLSLTDLYEVHLSQAQVAVLSACETALPGVKAIDEVLSLPAGWMLAGVPRVVGSLWSVDDLSTAMLMARFYDLWRGEGKPVAEALRQAQIWLRDMPLEDMLMYWREYPDRQVGLAFHRYLTQKSNSLNLRHPSYWAGFACVGLP
ncbi:CHAT domain-containing protein [Anaerolinea sp.]|uniref:CHAT domain-containing protein n=1 Tax=Anaerolinea sp. TaxID=1872519 RepID=UPI002ACD5456|nr:CHAT domain-containing protein [Anaerolinea sp.]